jgi:acyl carrier protein
MSSKFLELFKEALEIEGDIPMDQKFRDLDEWTSLSRLSLIAMLDDNYNVTIEDEVFKNLITVSDLFREVEKRNEAVK